MFSGINFEFETRQQPNPKVFTPTKHTCNLTRTPNTPHTHVTCPHPPLKIRTVTPYLPEYKPCDENNLHFMQSLFCRCTPRLCTFENKLIKHFFFHFHFFSNAIFKFLLNSYYFQSIS